MTTTPDEKTGTQAFTPPPEIMNGVLRQKIAELNDQLVTQEATISFQYDIIQGLQQQIRDLAGEASVAMGEAAAEEHTHDDGSTHTH
jgi:uncharacterized coiled-coil protein SlyX